MTLQALELEGTWEEIVAQSAQFAGRRVRVIILSEEDDELLDDDDDDDDDDDLSSIEESLRQAWIEIKTGQTLPISELWEGIDAERSSP